MKFHEEVEYLINLLKTSKDDDTETLKQLEDLIEEYARNYQYRNRFNKK